MDRFVTVSNRKRTSTEIIDNNINNNIIETASTSRNKTLRLEQVNIQERSFLEESENKYKKKYNQKFRVSWQTNYSWLEECQDPQSSRCTAIAKCKVCNTKIVGSLSHIKRHERTLAHTKNMRSYKITPSVLNTFQDNNSNERKHLTRVKEVELKIVGFLAENNLPFSLINNFVPFIKSVAPESKVLKDVHMKRTKATQLCNAVIGPGREKEVAKDLQVSNFSLIIDETTDISSKKCLAVVARYYKKGVFSDVFLSLIELESGTSESVFKSVMNLLNKYKIPLKNLTGIGADNCNVMMGDVTGFKALLRKEKNSAKIIGCTCHSLNLCSSYACSKLPKSVEQFARDIYNYFAHSTKKLQELRECQIFVEEKPHKLLKLAQTRWLSLEMVVNRILGHWNSLTLFFQRQSLEEKCNNATALLGALRNPVFKLYFFFLSYILKVINKMNLLFQSEKPLIQILLKSISTFYKSILKCFIKNEFCKDNNFWSKVQLNNPSYYLQLDEIYVGAEAQILINSNTITKHEIDDFKVKVLDFYIELCKQIKKRFDFSDPALKFAGNFDPKVAVSGDIQSISEAKEIFPYLDLNIEAVDLEWRLLSSMEECVSLIKDGDCDVTNFWCIVGSLKNGFNQYLFSNLMYVVKAVLCLPHSSAAAERIFSKLNLIKCKTRNRLLVNTCNSLLHTKDLLRNTCSQDWQPGEEYLTYNHTTLRNEIVLEDDIILQ